jgi:hypothetical protein
MRNSAAPLILVALATLACFALLQPAAEPGTNGPELAPGVFRLVKGERHTVASLPLTLSNRVEGGLEPAAAPAAQGPETWRAVTLSADDRSGPTRAVLLALAERLTAQGCVVVLDPLGAPPVLLGCDRSIRVATESATLPPHPGGECSARVVVTTAQLGFPAWHPAARLQPAGLDPTPRRFAVAHRSGAGAGQADLHWAPWWAAVGRGIAEAVLLEIAHQPLPALVDPAGGVRLAGVLPPADWIDTPVERAPGLSREQAQAAAEDYREHALLPQPLQCSTVRWSGCLQLEFVRGWVGEVVGRSTVVAGVEQPAVQPLLKLLTSGSIRTAEAWAEITATGSDFREWTREKDGVTSLFTIRPTACGWDLAMWQERHGIAALYQAWLEEAVTGGDASRAALAAAQAAGRPAGVAAAQAALAADRQCARAQLARYRGCAALPADQRTAADALLASGDHGGK